MQLLPLPGSFGDVKPGTPCKVAGWGYTSPGKPSKFLRETTLKTVDRKSCNKYYGNNVKITMLCATGKNKLHRSDTCQVRGKLTKGGHIFNNGSLLTGSKAVLDTLRGWSCLKWFKPHLWETLMLWKKGVKTLFSLGLCTNQDWEYGNLSLGLSVNFRDISLAMVLSLDTICSYERKSKAFRVWIIKSFPEINTWIVQN